MELSPGLSAEWPRGTSVTIWTLGHTHHPLDLFLSLLRANEISKVVDVRSKPYARHAQHYNRESLDPALTAAGITYQWLGDVLGQRPNGDKFYDDEGHTLYEVLVGERWFMKAIGQLEHEASQHRVALVCLEEQPQRCHRYHLLGKLLTDRGGKVLHIRRDGRVHSQAAITQTYADNQVSLFGDQSPTWRSPEPMRDGPGVPPASDPWETS